MAGYKLSIDIGTSVFPEIGTPLYPKSAKEVKPPKAYKEDYNSYVSNVSMSLSGFSSTFKRSSACLLCDDEFFSATFDFERDTSKTYKFLGMDIDENFDAIIKMSSGHVVVAPMFDIDKIVDYAEKSLRYYDSDSADKSRVRFLSRDAVRKLATYFKTGACYDMLTNINKAGRLYSEDLEPVIKIVRDDLFKTVSADGLAFDSVLLNLVHNRKHEQKSISNRGKSDDYETMTAKITISGIMNYWKEVVALYNSYYSTLASLDLWSDVNKKIIGEEGFYNRMGLSSQIIDNNDPNGDYGVASFSGIAKNGGVYDDNILRNSSVNMLYYALSPAMGTYESRSDNLDVKDILVGMMDTSSIDDIYSLTEAEMQAMSVLDSLSYVDDDAILCQESYDMNDPDQRGLFVKSAIRSYERNFREFKPSNNYDVTDALADLVERGDIKSEKVVSSSVATDETEEDIVTSTVEEIEVKVNKKQLIKVMKLVDTSLTKILKDF